MKKRYRAALALALVVLQLFCFFIPVSAADAAEGEGEGTWVEKSFNDTTIVDDFRLTDTELLSKYPFVETADKSAAEIISAITRKEEGGRDVALYLYIYVPSGTSNYLTGTVKISKPDNTSVLAPSMRKIDATTTILKVRVDMTESDYNAYLTPGKDRFQFYLESFQIRWRMGGSTSSTVQIISYDAITRALTGGKLCSGILLTASLDGVPMEWYVEEKLKLDVHLSAERYSTSESEKFSQINTAMFLVPTEYFYSDSNKYLELTKIVYQATFYHDVPMLVHTYPYMNEIYDKIVALGDVEIVSGKLLMHWEASRWNDKLYNIEKVVPLRNFVFYVDEIVEDAGGCMDVSPDQIIAALDQAKLDFAKDLSINDFADYIKALSYEPLKQYTVESTEEIKTSSFANSASWLEKLSAGRLFGTNIDDSIKVNMIQSVALADYRQLLANGFSTLAKDYALGPEGIEHFHALAKQAEFDKNSAEHTLVIMHYKETSYSLFDDVEGYEDENGNVDYFKIGDGLLDFRDGYIAYNVVVDDFQIIEMHYENENIRSVVPIVTPTYTFIAGLEGEDKLEDETYDPPDIKFPDFGLDLGGGENPFNDLWKKLFLVFRIILIVVIAVAVVWGGTKLFKFIGAARDAFGRRGGGRGGG